MAVIAGVPAASTRCDEWALAAEQRVGSPETVAFPFELPAIPDGQQVRLSLDARVDWPNLAGSNPWMIVAVNGRNVLRPDLLNKPFEFTMRCGMDTTWAYGAAWRLLYSPDFSDTVRTVPMPLGIPDCDPYRFVWDITQHVKPGENTVGVTHPQLLAEGTTLVLCDVRVEVGAPLAPLEATRV